MARPKVPLIDRHEVIAKALEIIDRDGLDAFSIRRIARDLGINGASLYHHFRDKDSILHGVRLVIAHENAVGDPPRVGESWQDYLRRATLGYRRSLLRHPNAAPLMSPNIVLRPFSFAFRDLVAAKLLEEGVPMALVLPVIDSVETLAYASALLNPDELRPQDRLRPKPDDGVPSLAKGIRAAPRSARKIFDLQLDALITGWTAAVARETNAV